MIVRLPAFTVAGTLSSDAREDFLLVVQPNEPVDLAAALRLHSRWISEMLLAYGGILFRGFGVDSPSTMRRVAEAAYERAMPYTGGNLPRQTVEKGVYTSDEISSQYRITPHYAMSYARTWPARLAFACVTPAKRGGRMPLCSGRRLMKHLHPKIVDEFERRRVSYVRMYADGVGPATNQRQTWAQCYQTESRTDVETFCRLNGIELEWLPSGGLRTRQTGHGVAPHPITGERIFFNHAHLLHTSAWPTAESDATRAAAIRQFLTTFPEEKAYYNVTFGDGGKMSVPVLDEVRRVIAEARVTFDWQRGDFLLLDNMLVLHGREEFSGDRLILSAHGDPCSYKGAAPLCA